MMMKPIVLIGFSGSGKSTLGRQLAARRSLPFADLDMVFESRHAVSIVDFFAERGEAAFRICEKVLLAELLGRGEGVIATGGGTPCFLNMMDLIKEKSFSVYIEFSPKSLFFRLLQSKRGRPLLAGKSEEELMSYIEATLFSRKKFYSRADLTVKGENLTVGKLLQAIEEVAGGNQL